MNPPELLKEPSGSASGLGYRIGQDFLRPLVRPDVPMGTWTGIPGKPGAALSGLLWGAGLGALYQGGRSLWDYGMGQERRPVPWWRHPVLLGALGGTTVGLLKGASALRAAHLGSSLSKTATSKELLSRVIGNDPSLNDYERGRLLQLVNRADSSQLYRMGALAAVGGLTASAAYSILGTGYFGSAVIGGLAAGAAHSIFPRKTTYV